MNIEVAKKAVRLLFKLAEQEKQLILTFFGGEPTLEFDKVKLLTKYGQDLAKNNKKRINFNIVSNGILLDNDKLRFLKENDIFLLLSMDGDKQTQDMHRITKRGLGSFDSVYKNLRETIKTLSPWVGVNMTVNPDTATFFYENIKFFVEHKIYKIAFNIVYEANWDEDTLEVFTDQLDKVIDLWIDMYETPNLLWLQPLHHFIKHELNPKKYRVQYWAHPCKDNRISISANGEIFPCHRMVAFQNYKIGDIKDEEIDYELWNRYLEEKDKLFTEFPLYGGCPSLNYEMNGSVTEPLSNFKIFGEIFTKAAEKALYILDQKGYEK
jgi:uncharacterized protein